MKSQKLKNFLLKNKRFFLFLYGGLGYGIVELFWRGHTHWTMLLAGGACFSVYYKLCEDEKNMPFFIKCAIGAVLITAIELMFGTVVNVWLHWNVWDYSAMPFHFYGQICLPFFALWFFLCIPLTKLCDTLRHKLA